MFNTIINQPVAIESGYLNSLLPTLFLKFQQQDFKSSAEIDNESFKNLENQAASATATGADKFPVVIDIKGPIVKYSSWYYLGTQTIGSIIHRLENNERVSGILFNIDSGGGMVSGTAELHSIIKECSLPTIAYTNGYMCSAAMWIAAGCDVRIAHPDADMIGSIGTMMSYQDYSAMFEKWGAKIYEVYAPASSEKSKEFRELLAGNKKAYEERLTHINNKFIESIKSALGDKLNDDGKIFKGKTYNPKQALEVGLIDEIGTIQEALYNF